MITLNSYHFKGYCQLSNIRGFLARHFMAAVFNWGFVKSNLWLIQGISLHKSPIVFILTTEKKI